MSRGGKKVMEGEMQKREREREREIIPKLERIGWLNEGKLAGKARETGRE